MIFKDDLYKFFRSDVGRDFIRPIIIPFLLFGFFFLAMYIGSKYYGSGNLFERIEALKKLPPPEFQAAIKEILRKNDIHCYITIVSTILQLINQIILIIIIITYFFYTSEFLENTYYIQMYVISTLFGIGTFLSFAIPKIEISILEDFYLNYVQNNMIEFFFTKVTPVTVFISYSLIYVTNDIRKYKRINSSGWHRISLLILLIFLTARGAYDIYYTFKQLNTNLTIKNNISSFINVIDVIKNKIM